MDDVTTDGELSEMGNEDYENFTAGWFIDDIWFEFQCQNSLFDFTSKFPGDYEDLTVPGLIKHWS